MRSNEPRLAMARRTALRYAVFDILRETVAPALLKGKPRFLLL